MVKTKTVIRYLKGKGAPAYMVSWSFCPAGMIG
jgi:hypothetical protein